MVRAENRCLQKSAPRTVCRKEGRAGMRFVSNASYPSRPPIVLTYSPSVTKEYANTATVHHLEALPITLRIAICQPELRVTQQTGQFSSIVHGWLIAAATGFLLAVITGIGALLNGSVALQ